MYEAFFGLSARPFQLNPDPDFFFGSRGHKRALAYLEYGLHQGEGFIVITGEVGAGKTTLLRNMLRRIPSQTVEAAQIVSTQVEADDLLRLVAAAFGVRSEGLDKSTLLIRLEEFFRQLHAAGRRALLIVDEAQNLSPRAVEELRMLSNFQSGTSSLVQSFLVGQPEFRLIMQRPEMRQLKQRVIASYHLGPLDRQETQRYIEHRLGHVGWHNDPEFADDAFDRIFACTAGVPRRINTLCDRLLLGTFLSERHTISGADVDETSSELADELGLQRVAAAPAASALNGHAAPAPEPEPIGEDRVSELENRVAVLEASTGMTYGVLKKVLAALKRPSQDDAPK